MAVGRAERFDERRSRIQEFFDEPALKTVFALLELTEMAWHDCYGEVTPPEDVIDDILVCSGGDLEKLVRAADLAVIDRRDLRMWADDTRKQGL
jgi:hypothetical protein